MEIALQNRGFTNLFIHDSKRDRSVIRREVVYRAIEPDVNKTKNQLSGYNNTWLREESSMSREAAIFSLDDSFLDREDINHRKQVLH